MAADARVKATRKLPVNLRIAFSSLQVGSLIVQPHWILSPTLRRCDEDPDYGHRDFRAQTDRSGAPGAFQAVSGRGRSSCFDPTRRAASPRTAPSAPSRYVKRRNAHAARRDGRADGCRMRVRRRRVRPTPTPPPCRATDAPRNRPPLSEDAHSAVRPSPNARPRKSSAVCLVRAIFAAAGARTPEPHPGHDIRTAKPGNTQRRPSASNPHWIGIIRLFRFRLASMAVLSPCVGICRIHPQSRLCEGCGRSLVEIAEWPAWSDERRRAVLARLARRNPSAQPASPTPRR